MIEVYGSQILSYADQCIPEIQFKNHKTVPWCPEDYSIAIWSFLLMF